MKRDLNELLKKEYDVIIIGGGIFGATALWEAAHRGLSACLIERDDFCEATSANHYKMVHGGIRYIQHGDLIRLRESSVERSAFLRIAPHLVNPLPILIPTYGHGMKGKELLKIGMFLYDSITADRNYKVNDPKGKIPFGNSINRDEVINLFPGVKQEGLTGGVVFNDAQMYNPPRLVLSFIKSACEMGSDAINYAEAEELLIKDNKCYGVKVIDKFSSDVVEIRGKYVLNTTGPWAADFLSKSGITFKMKPSFSRDTAFVLNRTPENNIALAVTLKTKDVDTLIDRGGRHIFIVPWIDRNKLLVGVWHIVWDKSEDKIFVTEQEKEEFISEVNEAYPLKLSVNDIALVNTGLTLFGETTPGSKRMSFGKRSWLIDHKLSHNIEGLITLIGVRATMGRGMAEKVIDLLFDKLGEKFYSSKSKYLPLYGGNFSSFDSLFEQTYHQFKGKISQQTLRSLLHNHGSHYNEVLNNAVANPSLFETIGGSDILKAEIVNSVENEMALRLKDIILRRTDLGTAGYPGKQSIETCAALMADKLGWNENRKQIEIEDVEQFYHSKSAVKLYNSQFALTE